MSAPRTPIDPLGPRVVPGRVPRMVPLRWILFGAGGLVAAFLLPGILLVVGALGPAGSVQGEPFAPSNLGPAAPVLRWALHAVVALLLFHTAFRLRHGARDLGLRRGSPLEPLLWLTTYGVAWVWTLIGLVDVLWSITAGPAAR